MAIINSIIKFRGTIDGITIDRNGVVKKAAGPRETIPERTKENNSEFGTAAKQGKVFREALRALGGDSHLSSRMLQAVRRGISLDTTNDRGKRILSNQAAKTVLTGFELHANNLGSLAPIAISLVANKVKVEKLGGGNLTVEDVFSPEGTTDVELVAVVAKLNIDPEVLSVDDIKVATVSAKKGALVLPNIEAKADAKLLTIVGVGIQFYQEVNDKLYSLNNGAYDAGKIVEVIPPVTTP
jgi:hypothetical protein